MGHFNRVAALFLVIVVLHASHAIGVHSKAPTPPVVGGTILHASAKGELYGYPYHERHHERRPRRHRRKNSRGCGKIRKLRKNLRVAKRRFNRLLFRKASLQARLVKQSKRAANVKKQFDQLTAQKASLLSQRNNLTTAIAALKEDVVTKKAAVTRKKADVLALQKILGQEKNNLVSALSAKASADAYLETAKHRLAAARNKLQLHPYSKRLRRRVRKAIRELSAALHAVTAAAETVTVAKTVVIGIQDQIAAGILDVTALENAISTLLVQLNNAEEKLAPVQKNIELVLNKIGKVTFVLAKIKRKRNRLTARIAVVEDKIIGAKITVQNARAKLENKLKVCRQNW